ncbi:hypothetical protein ACTMTJ_40510 [Phytohabitans sp. LJ34]|uniref:hypothetical protein n=1 Tax=Phytohabitans sp. LJ34 TaxID=3452217 RepID=UPI003F890733
MDALTEWLDLTEARIQLMQDAVGFVTDQSSDSLAALQDVLDSLDDEERLGAAAYLGESLLAAADGEWGWDASAKRPIVVPDPALGLPPVSPIDEIDAAAGERDGRLAALHRTWAAAAGPRAETSSLAAWLARQESGFPAWAARYGPGVEWDFSVGSLDRLEEVLRRTVTSVAELTDGRQRYFSDGASWYYGEVLRRGLGGFWEDDVDFVYLQQVGPHRGKIIPVLALERAVAEPGHLRDWYSMYAR